MAHLHIGEIKVSSTSKETDAILLCRFPKEGELLLKVYDKYGFICQKEFYTTEEGEMELSFNCGELKGGKYSAWIEIEGKTFLRGFFIDQKETKGILKKVKRLFQVSQYGGAYY